LNVSSIVTLVRPKQWVKNGFVFAPIFFSAQLTSIEVLKRIVVASICFCFISSAVYVLNDLCDMEADRQHAKKRNRPLASGAVKPVAAIAVLVALVAAAAAAALMVALPLGFYLLVGVYIAVNIGYSLGLKQIAVLELMLVSSGFLIRLLAGGAAISVELSSWIIVATAMISLLLTIGKRRGDLVQNNDETHQRQSLKGYTVAYLDALLAATAGGVVVVYLIFCTSDYATHRYGPYLIATAVFVGLGVMRYLQIVMAKGGGDSPTDLVLGDPFILAVVAGFIGVFALLIYI